MCNAGLDEAQAKIKIAGRNINNLRFEDATILMEESEEPLDESERGEWKSWLETQHSKKQRSWHLVPSLHVKDGETMETVRDYFIGLQNHCRW